MVGGGVVPRVVGAGVVSVYGVVLSPVCGVVASVVPVTVVRSVVPAVVAVPVVNSVVAIVVAVPVVSSVVAAVVFTVVVRSVVVRSVVVGGGVVGHPHAGLEFSHGRQKLGSHPPLYNFRLKAANS